VTKRARRAISRFGCGEIGTFEASSSSIRFVLKREEGIGCCLIGDVRVAALASDASGSRCRTRAGEARYVRADAVAKIFLTLDTHDGDFLHDATLAGANAVAKADAFCNRSSAVPHWTAQTNATVTS